MSLFQIGYLLLDHVCDSISCNTLLFSDIIIDCENSTGFIESGKGHKIMKCVMKKALTNSTVRFYWHRSNGQLQPGREIYFKDCELSQKTVVTDMYAQFNPVRRTAKTKTSSQTLTIKMKQLHEWLYLVINPCPLTPPPPKKKTSSGVKWI